MKSTASKRLEQSQGHNSFPGASALAALRAWYSGLSTRAAVAQYLGHTKADGQSSRAVLGKIRRQLVSIAQVRHRKDLVELIAHPATERLQRAGAVLDAIETLRELPLPTPLVTDAVDLWLLTNKQI
jgi:hypothetical protein